MPGHFLAFYRCSQCKEPVGALVSNTMLIVAVDGSDDGRRYKLIDPRESNVMTNLWLYCSACAATGLPSLDLKCRGCRTRFSIHYFPETVKLRRPPRGEDEEEKELTVFTRTLLGEAAGTFAYCFPCGKSWEQKSNREPIFLFERRDNK